MGAKSLSNIGELVQLLVAKKQYLAGVDFLSQALPAREAIWWGCLCMRHVTVNKFSPMDRAACKAAVQWVLQPNEENRSAGKIPGDAAGHSSPAGLLAMAVALSAQHSHREKMVANAVKLASTKAVPAKIVDTQRLFVELGIGVADARFTWPDISRVTIPRWDWELEKPEN